MCSMVLKEVISYYVNNGSSVFCFFSTPPRPLIECNIVLCLINYSLQMLIYFFENYGQHLYRGLVKVLWNGVYSQNFSVINDVKEGGILSPVLFSVCIDESLLVLRQTDVGYFLGSWFVGALAYVDNISFCAVVTTFPWRCLLSTAVILLLLLNWFCSK